MSVNKFDNSMFDAGTIGTTANKLLQLDGTSKIPAVDGSLLTGIVGFTASASDPVITTNPSGGVGTIWKNTTSGEVYCCTDATAGANVWKNVGAGTGDIEPQTVWNERGLTYGYATAGQGYPASPPHTDWEDIERFPFASDSNSTDTSGNMPDCVTHSSCHSSETHGYQSGSYPTGTNLILKYSFASPGSGGSDIGNLVGGNNSGQYGACSASDPETTAKGYIAGGYTPVATYITDIVSVSFTSDGNAVDSGYDLALVSYHTQGVGSPLKGYTFGGNTASGHHNDIQGYSYSSMSNATVVADLIHGQSGLPGCNSSGTYGYKCGGTNATNSGYPPGVYGVDEIEKFNFSTEADSVDIANLTRVVQHPGACSSMTHGYILGGYIGDSPSVYGDHISKFTFASDNNATEVGSLIRGATLRGAHQV